MNKHYKIADLFVDMDTFGRTEKQAEIYITDEFPDTPDMVVLGNSEAFQVQHPNFSLDDSEYMTTGSYFSAKLVSYDGIVLHSSAVIVDGKAYLFSAPSGVGKSTHTAMWLKKFGPQRSAILNDDKPAIRLIDGKFYAYGTPWSGNTDVSLNLSVPIAGICILKRGEVNKITPHTGSRALYDLLNQTVRLRTPEGRSKQVELLSQLIEKVPIWLLECNMDLEAAEVAYRAMSGNKGE